MIISRIQAEEAAKELLIHALFLSGDMTEQHVKEAYRSRAGETHPDKGGTIEQFAAVDRAKHVLTHWLARVPEGVAKPLADDCPKCEGKGFIRIQRGFRSLPAQCEKCRGTGDLSFEHDKVGD